MWRAQAPSARGTPRALRARPARRWGRREGEPPPLCHSTSMAAPVGAGSSDPWGAQQPPHAAGLGIPAQERAGLWSALHPSRAAPRRGPAARARPPAPPRPRPSPPHAQPLLQLPQALRPHGARVETAVRPHHPPGPAPRRSESENGNGSSCGSGGDLTRTRLGR